MPRKPGYTSAASSVRWNPLKQRGWWMDGPQVQAGRRVHSHRTHRLHGENSIGTLMVHPLGRRDRMPRRDAGGGPCRDGAARRTFSARVDCANLLRGPEHDPSHSATDGTVESGGAWAAFPTRLKIRVLGSTREKELRVPRAGDHAAYSGDASQMTVCSSRNSSRMTVGRQQIGQSSTYSCCGPALGSMGITISSPQQGQM